MPGPLFRIWIRQSRRQPLRTGLMIFGIALGVAGMIAIDIARTSIGRSFELSTSALTARSTHQIVGSRFSIPQSLFTRLRVELGISASAPVISRQVQCPDMGGGTFRLLGIDPFSETHFRSFETLDTQDSSPFDFTASGPVVLVSRTNAHRFGLVRDGSMDLRFGGRTVRVVVGGFLDTGTSGVHPADGIILTDIAVAQALLEMGDQISRIDLALSPGQAETVAQILPDGIFLVRTDRSNRAVRDLSRSFETSLTAFSMLALFMGIFLIYNTVSFSVARQRQINGTLKALGVTGRQIFFMVVLEVLFFSVVGSSIGLLLGTALGRGAVAAVSSTVSDMYFVLTVSRVEINAATLIRGGGAGMAAALFAAVFPALGAAGTVPVTLMQRSAPESRMARQLPALALAGSVLILGGLALIRLTRHPAAYDYVGVFLLFLGAALLAPGVIALVFRLFEGLIRRLGRVLVKMAIRNIVRSLSRTSVMIASLMVVISVFIGIEIMTYSFRTAIADWVDGHIGGHIHLSSADELDRGLDPVLVEQVAALPGVADVSAYNIHRVYSRASGEVHLFSYVRDLSVKHWTWTAVPEVKISELMDRDWVIVSEIFASTHGFDPARDKTITLESAKGPVPFRVAGVFRDFFMGGGRVVVGRRTMADYWGYTDITSVQLFVHDPENAGETMARIRAMIPEDRLVKLTTGRQIKASVLSVFDKTFLITTALQLLTALVAFTGIFNSVTALLMERAREMGILRACGAQPAQVSRLMLMECGLNGFLSGALALPLGLFLAWVLIDVVNQRSFGWSYDMVVAPNILIQAVLLSVGAALTAGIYPAVRAGRVQIRQALQME